MCKKNGHKNFGLSSRNLYIFTQYEQRHSLTAGTIIDSSKKSFIYWFKAMWRFTKLKSGINAVNLKELQDFVSNSTTWGPCFRRYATVPREKLSGRIEVDLHGSFGTQ